MSSATSTKTPPKANRDESLQPWQLFVLAGLGCATVVTFIARGQGLTAVVLFEFATAQPKGFALTLILGVAVSMLTAILFTRAMLGVLAGFAFFSRPAFMGVKPSQIETVPEEARGGRRRRAATGDMVVETAGETAAPAPARASGGGRRTTTSRKKKRRR